MAQQLGAPVALTGNSHSVSSPYIGTLSMPVIPVTRDPSLFWTPGVFTWHTCNAHVHMCAISHLIKIRDRYKL